MSSLSEQLMAGRTSCPTPKISAQPFTPGAPSSSTPAPKAKHMPAAKFPPAEANFVDAPHPSGERPSNLPKMHRPSTEHSTKTSNSLNLDAPTSGPSPSVPGELRGKNKDREQRGEPAFKGDDTNKQSVAEQEFSHYYYAVDPEHFFQALDFEYYKPGNFQRVQDHPLGDGF
eukprot:14592069-Alexandrium_andersonii.AAC.1